jgi:protein arginine kinase activator
MHITELVSSKPAMQLHLCDECAHEYLSDPQVKSEAGALAAAAGQHAAAQQAAAEDLSRLDQMICPVCGISFLEFRKKGRLGCAFDYTAFAEELEPLIVSIHGESEHRGRAPQFGAENSVEWTKLIRLRSQLQDSIKEERYEEASRLRDQIKTVESTMPQAPH